MIAPNDTLLDPLRAQVSCVLDSLPHCCSDRGFTYFLQCGVYVKIGKAKNVMQRILDLQTATPYALTLLDVGRGDLERYFHNRCRNWWVRGEWFGAECWTADLIALHKVSGKYCMCCAVSR